MNTTDELSQARERLGVPAQDINPNDPNPNGRSLADRAGDEPEPAEQEELFVLEQGRRVTLSQMISRGTTIEYRVTMNTKSIKGGNDMGLLPFNSPDILLVAPARQGKVTIDPTYNEDGDVLKVTVRVSFKPLTIHDATSVEGRALLGLEDA